MGLKLLDDEDLLVFDCVGVFMIGSWWVLSVWGALVGGMMQMREIGHEASIQLILDLIFSHMVLLISIHCMYYESIKDYIYNLLFRRIIHSFIISPYMIVIEYILILCNF